MFFAALWKMLLGFSFYYPMLMAYLWMIGALSFYRTERQQPAYNRPAPLKETPKVAVLIPCFNEGDNAEETIRYALALNYPDFEVIAINDGSSDNTATVLDRLCQQHERLRVVHLAENQGKAMALQAGALVTDAEFLIGIDGDALLDAHAASWMVRHFIADPSIAAVTGNPRIRTRSTLIGRIQVGEFSSIVGMIKRAQRSFGRLFTVSGVITAFRKSALHEVGYWSADMLTEDIDISWKLQRAGWDIEFEPNALVWILMPETLKGLWKQRLRWAMGGAQVLIKNIDALWKPQLNFLWPLLLEMCLTLVWAYSICLITLLWLLQLLLPDHWLSLAVSSPVLPAGTGLFLGLTCLVQFVISKWMDSRYEPYLLRNIYWMIWYPFIFWLITLFASVVAFPKVLLLGTGKRARWVSPDRGLRVTHLDEKLSNE